uniref:Uncharacterized protein n=1 Tax=Arundo donax TaxID=35708 RepID=A0A0A8YH65_ARUDO
MSIFILKENSS